VVQANDNEYYLNHSFDKSYSLNGWVFMDYRNTMLEDKNTIFYGHNLLNKTSFGSLVNLFSSNYHDIIIQIITENGVYKYQVFSGYLIDEEVYYLQNNFYSDDDYSKYLEVISKRNILSVDSSVSIEDQIITLSTCTDDNKGRRVIHAKRISS
ncbi:MAG: class B sortase, partial [Bacilli bacterium]|nr:class B sortase [Bacilli bacterium]